MLGMPFNSLGKGGGGVFQVSNFVDSFDNFLINEEVQVFFNNSNCEPTSVLVGLRGASSSPISSTSTMVPSAGSGSSSVKSGSAGAAVNENLAPGEWSNLEISNSVEQSKDEWIPVSGGVEVDKCGGGGGGLNLEDWENMLSDPGGQEQSFGRWISGGDVDDSSFGLKHLLQSGGNGIGNNSHHLQQQLEGLGGIVDHNLGFDGNPSMCSSSSANNLTPLPVSLLSHGGVVFQPQRFEEKPQVFNPQPDVMMNSQSQSHNANFFPVMPSYGNIQDPHPHLLQPQAKRRNSGGIDNSSQIPKPPFAFLGHEFLLNKHQQQQQLSFLPNQLQQLLPPPNNQLHNVQLKPPLMVPKPKPLEEMGQAILDQLFKAAELVGTGNFTHAQEILARLNHQLSLAGKPLQRAAFYFKEALQMVLTNNNKEVTPSDVIYKMGSYKAFSEISPVIQFANFTCNQALLEALDDTDKIHVVDFDIGFGAQWASFMQELSMRGTGVTSLKITVFASPSNLHPVELGLLRESLTLFANEIGIAFEFDVVDLESFDPDCCSISNFRFNEYGETTIAVNFPVWSSSIHPNMLPSLLRFIKKLSPRIIVSLDQGCDRYDLPFSQHLFHALQSHINLLESLDAANVAVEVVNKIEKFLLQPKIESSIVGRLRAPEKMPLFKTLVATGGFMPVQFSNFTETQADCVMKRMPSRGFHVEKRQATLVLCWQRRELISASAWRC